MAPAQRSTSPQLSRTFTSPGEGAAGSFISCPAHSDPQRLKCHLAPLIPAKRLPLLANQNQLLPSFYMSAHFASLPRSSLPEHKIQSQAHAAGAHSPPRNPAVSARPRELAVVLTSTARPLSSVRSQRTRG